MSFHLNAATEGLLSGYGKSIATLGLLLITITPVIINGGSGGGPYPGPAWNKVSNIGDFYRPVEPYPEFTPHRQTRAYAITVTLDGQTVERIYEVTEKQHDMVVKMIGMTNKSYKPYVVSASTVRRRINTVFAKINRVLEQTGDK